MNWPFKIFKISGHSMQPLITDGDLLLVNAWAYLFRQPKIGEIVVFRQADKLFCKRITAMEGRDYAVAGDNKSDSLDSGPISFPSIIGRAIIRVAVRYCGAIRPEIPSMTKFLV